MRLLSELADVTTLRQKLPHLSINRQRGLCRRWKGRMTRIMFEFMLRKSGALQDS